jgi:hypothetical protein
MTTTSTRTRRPAGKLPGVPTLSREDRHRLRVRTIDAEIVSGLVMVLSDYNGDRLPPELERLEPLYRRFVRRNRSQAHRTYGQILRHLADLADLSDVLWDGGHGTEDDDGNEIEPEQLYPCLAQLR